MPILYEPSSTRGDHGIWCLTYGQPTKTPFKFDWKGKTKDSTVTIDIDTSCYVIFNIKEYMDDVPVISKKVNMQEDNIAVLEINYSESLILRMENEYHLTVTLYDAEDNIIRILLRDLPIRILKSGVENE